jgi:predicted HTH transcriptional regulator
MIKYVSAFANHEGGHIYFGIGDARASVIGEELTLPDQKNLGKVKFYLSNVVKEIRK